MLQGIIRDAGHRAPALLQQLCTDILPTDPGLRVSRAEAIGRFATKFGRPTLDQAKLAAFELARQKHHRASTSEGSADSLLALWRSHLLLPATIPVKDRVERFNKLLLNAEASMSNAADADKKRFIQRHAACVQAMRGKATEPPVANIEPGLAEFVSQQRQLEIMPGMEVVDTNGYTGHVAECSASDIGMLCMVKYPTLPQPVQMHAQHLCLMPAKPQLPKGLELDQRDGRYRLQCHRLLQNFLHHMYGGSERNRGSERNMIEQLSKAARCLTDFLAALFRKKLSASAASLSGIATFLSAMLLELASILTGQAALVPADWSSWHIESPLITADVKPRFAKAMTQVNRFSRAQSSDMRAKLRATTHRLSELLGVQGFDGSDVICLTWLANASLFPWLILASGSAQPASHAAVVNILHGLRGAAPMNSRAAAEHLGK